jgi:glutamate synthase domain-containing protein 3
MSGGFAYVLDESGDFSATLCNRSMVDVDPLDANDEETVRKLVKNHFEYTASPRARFLLDRWPQQVKKFVKVFPHDYKRVLGVALHAARKIKESVEKVEEVSHG